MKNRQLCCGAQTHKFEKVSWAYMKSLVSWRDVIRCSREVIMLWTTN